MIPPKINPAEPVPPEPHPTDLVELAQTPLLRQPLRRLALALHRDVRAADDFAGRGVVGGNHDGVAAGMVVAEGVDGGEDVGVRFAAGCDVGSVVVGCGVCEGGEGGEGEDCWGEEFHGAASGVFFCGCSMLLVEVLAIRLLCLAVKRFNALKVMGQ